MKRLRAIMSTTAAFALATAATGLAAEIFSPGTARSAVRAVSESGRTIADAIKLAEEKTGGKAISAELMSPDDAKSAYGWWTDDYRTDGDVNANDRAARERDADRDSRTVTRDQDNDRDDRNDRDDDEVKVRTSTDNTRASDNARTADRNKTDENNRDRATANRDRTNDRAFNRDNVNYDAHVAVTCLVNDTKLRTVLVDLAANKVVSERSSSYYEDQNNDRYSSGNSWDRDSRNDYRGQNDRSDWRNQNNRDNQYNAGYASDSDRQYRSGNYVDHRGSNTRWNNNNDYDNDRNWQNRQMSSTTGNQYQSNWDQSDDQMTARYQQRGRMMLASKMLNATVENYRNQNIGDIDDIAIDPDSHNVLYTAMTRGGFLGLGQKHFAIPTQEFSNMQGRTIRVNMQPNEFKNAEGFDGTNWPKQADQRWSSDWDSSRRMDMKPASKVAKASDLIGKDLKNNNGETLGDIEDLVIDAEQSKVAYVLVDKDNGMVAIPTAALMHRGEECRVNITMQQFKNLPTFRDGNYPDWNNARWNRQTHSNFNVQPYWQGSNVSMVQPATTGQ